ncbi:hypothetical protein BDR26DRAFT_862129 [Obelidium mucronatum]|nr:hypothetical protein BDR26DRAFT_862129 [Obelidium mucronatum]
MDATRLSFLTLLIAHKMFGKLESTPTRGILSVLCTYFARVFCALLVFGSVSIAAVDSSVPKSTTSSAAAPTMSLTSNQIKDSLNMANALHSMGMILLGKAPLPLDGQTIGGLAVSTDGMTSYTPTNNLIYYGGPLISNVVVNPIYYGSATYFQADLKSFYTFITSSAYMETMAPYNTSTVKIGKGTFGTVYVEKNVLPVSTIIDDSDLKSYLKNLTIAGVIKPTANSYYPIHFARGYTISQGGGKSCFHFCGYHSTIDISGISVAKTKYLYYAVIPDQTDWCYGRCGGDPDPKQNLFSVASHELAEAITNPAVGAATIYGEPLAWYDSTRGEIGDVCSAIQTPIKDSKGKSYSVQKLWSNNLQGCYAILPPPTTTTTRTTTTTATQTITVISNTTAAAFTTISY